MKFIKKKTFYSIPVWEFNLPAGHTCPFGKDCKILVDRKTGKFTTVGTKFRCYASTAERFPGVRESRWKNYDDVRAGKPIEIPEGATHVRIHGSGDFFSQEYFDMWLEVCWKHPGVMFWAFTKSVEFWIRRLDAIPPNLTLQASKGGHQDELIDRWDLKYAEVFTDIKDVPEYLPIDTDDDFAMTGRQSFALLDNFKYSKKDRTLVDEHNRRFKKRVQ